MQEIGTQERETADRAARRLAVNQRAYRTLASRSRMEILHLLQQQDGALGVDVVATHVGLHPNTTREHLDRLVAAGFVAREVEHRSTRGRPRLLYRAVERAAASAADVRARDQLARVLVAGYGRAMRSPAAEAERAGRRWAVEHPSDDVVAQDPETGQLQALERHFEELGYDPEVDADALEVHLHRCPLLDLARERTEVVCSVHLGLSRGVLARQGGPLAVDRLEPFVGPEHCVLHLRRVRAQEPAEA